MNSQLFGNELMNQKYRFIQHNNCALLNTKLKVNMLPSRTAI